MVKIRKSNERGHTNLGWLDSYHTFSFGDYYDADYIGFHKLRVINEDRIKGGTGFGSHPHRDMEIITYIQEGSLEHKDSIANGSVIKKGDMQRMSAGTGVVHSEYNHSESEPVHLLQIWILPKEKGIKPSYEERSIDPNGIKGNLSLVATGTRSKKNEALYLNQDVDIYLSSLEMGQEVKHIAEADHHLWVQAIRGSLILNGKNLEQGDGASIQNEGEIIISTNDSAEFLLFDME
ncbi:MAG TPA: pirin family protein [Thermodesulfobacteriota bacterium]|jgi:redox-sensitive bicupin YhaK (pirin superfamily)